MQVLGTGVEKIAQSAQLYVAVVAAEAPEGPDRCSDPVRTGLAVLGVCDNYYCFFISILKTGNEKCKSSKHVVVSLLPNGK